MSARAPRLHQPGPLPLGECVDLHPAAARHVQVLRLQPGDPVVLFDGCGVQVRAHVERIERRAVAARIEAPEAATPELSVAAWLAVVVPANDRMDAVVEKATELGMAGLQPLWAQRSVVRFDAARAEARRAHWEAVAVAACEQCGRARVPEVRAPRALGDWLREPGLPPRRLLLSPEATEAAGTWAATEARSSDAVVALSGPEGGFTDDERRAARAAGFIEVSLGPRVLRADTAPLAWLAHLMLTLEGRGG